MNPGFEADDKSTSVESMEEKQITNHAEKPAQRSNSKLLALVVIVCSLVVLLLTILMYGKIGDRCDCSSNEGQCFQCEVLRFNPVYILLKMTSGIDFHKLLESG